MNVLSLVHGQADCWSIPLDIEPSASADLYGILSADECSRCARLRFERDRRRFVVAHGVLRTVLGRYVDIPPQHLRFTRSARGKPNLEPGVARGLRFNLSHAAGVALVAVAADVEVGVDVERVRPLPDPTEIARCFFPAAEAAKLQRLPPHLQGPAFFRSWTRTEARVKASGEGLEAVTNGDAVDDALGVAAGRSWSVLTVLPAPGYIGAVVIEGTGWGVRQLRWEAA